MSILLERREIIDAERYLDHALERQTGLSSRQYQMLYLIGEKGGVLSAALAKYARVAPTVITGLIDRMERVGLVTRVYPNQHRGDRRVTLLFLTEAGKKALVEADVVLESVSFDGDL